MTFWIWHANQWLQQPWTLWTSAFVHLGSAHALANLLALAGLVWLARNWGLGWPTAMAALAAWPTSVAALAFWPAVQSYQGLSGPLHGLAAAMALHHGVHHARPGRHGPQQPPAGAVVLALGLALKLGLEHGWSLPLGFDPAWGFNVVYASHFTGAVCGLLFALATLRRRETPDS
ncbi:MAG: rhomboid family intramembrane serine protease [Ramlibacter sp.]|nr:rhomboid family intramembrane serine protease [Ramlibacter sp.]